MAMGARELMRGAADEEDEDGDEELEEVWEEEPELSWETCSPPLHCSREGDRISL
jgi:hypothetical protein